MVTVSCRISVMLAMCVLVELVPAQITFSRDWAGGKRSASQVDVDCSRFTRLCRHFVHELKQAMIEGRAAKRRKEDSDNSPTYDYEY